MFFSQDFKEHSSLKNVSRNLQAIVGAKTNFSELVLVSEMSKFYKDPLNNFARLPLDVLLEHIIPFIDNKVAREFHKRALLYKEYMDIKDHVHIKLSKCQKQAKWYGDKLDEMFKIFLLPEELGSLKSGELELDNEQCEKFLAYINAALSKIPHDVCGDEVQSILKDSQEKHFQHTFNGCILAQHNLLQSCQHNVKRNAMYGIILVLFYVIFTGVGAVKLGIQNPLSALLIISWPALLMLAIIAAHSINEMFNIRLSLCISQSQLLKENFNIKNMVQDICNRMEVIANNIHDLEPRIDQPFIINIPDLIPEFSENVHFDKNAIDLEAGLINANNMKISNSFS
jgi:hypothetical protein